MKLPDKLYQYLVDLYDTSTTSDIHEFLVYSQLYVDELPIGMSGLKGRIELFFSVDPDVFKKYQNNIDYYAKSVGQKLESISKIKIYSTIARPDLNKYRINKNDIAPIFTSWSTINSSQEHLLKLQNKAKETIDFQNIGNASRTLLQNLSNVIFDPEKHVSEDPSIDLSKGKFKNRLHTYIRTELSSKQLKTLKSYVLSLIESADKAVDLSNNLTHDLNALKFMSETCVISVLSLVKIINLIHSGLHISNEN